MWISGNSAWKLDRQIATPQQNEGNKIVRIAETISHTYTVTRDAGPDRDAQFRFISDHAKEFLGNGLPVIFVDTKKKELIGNLKNSSSEFRPEKQSIKVNDHDSPDPDLGKDAPYGIYDIGRNEGFVHVGLSADTGTLAVNSIRSWWISMGKERYPNVNKLMITADGGENNGRRNRL